MSASVAGYPHSTEDSAKETLTYGIPTEEELNIPYDSSDDELIKLQELQPPGVDSYIPFDEKAAAKPRKGGKKYNPEEKLINKAPEDAKKTTPEDQQLGFDSLDFIIRTLFQGLAKEYNIRSRSVNDETIVLNKGEYIPSV